MNNLDWLEEHSRNPYHCGAHPTASHAETISSLICSDTVLLQANQLGDEIQDLWHTATGCLVCQASASFVCQWAEKRLVSVLQKTSEKDYLGQLCPLTPMRQQCALLAFRCLKILLGNINTGNADK